MLLRLNVLSSMTTRKGFYLDATVHQRVVFTAVKRSFARVKKERTKDQSMVLLGCPSTPESGFHGGKTKFCQSENRANEDQSMVLLGCSSTPESGFHGGKTKFCQSEKGTNGIFRRFIGCRPESGFHGGKTKFCHSEKGANAWRYL